MVLYLFFIYLSGDYVEKIYSVFLLIIFICTFSLVGADIKKSDLELLGKVIYVDPGHGGPDPGTLYKDIYEKDINLEICKKLQTILEEEGAIVYLTRYGDYDLSKIYTGSRKKSDLNNRAKIINDSKADIYISIHLNSISSSTWSGAQVFYDDINKNNYDLAMLMQDQLKKDLKTTREVKEISTMLMNRKITIPGILIEAGFLSNPNDRYLLQKSDYQYKIVESIKKGIIRYFD
ncbi:MAG: N-acetylmuramoyl-L-alanine amidase CwlD [Firmicutes bacterium]|nr:N-acetylmuramoyl-L-alanine amidase CwlD [Bacillota bacterium]